MSSACVFCEILSKSRAANVVYDEGGLLAILDHRPLFHGHVLVVPKTHVVELADLDPAEVGPLFSLVRRMTRAVEAALGADGTFVAINNKVSQSVPHLHVHVIPRKKKDGLKGFFWPRQPYEDEAHAARVRDAIAAEVARVVGPNRT